MKNLFLLLISIVALNFSSQAQKSKKATAKLIVPELVNNSFTVNFSDSLKKNWEKNHMGNYVAKFNDDHQTQSAEFNKDGVLLKSIIEYKAEFTPEVVINAVNTDYANAKIVSAEKIMIEKMIPYYKVNITTAENKNKVLFVTEEGLVTQ